MGTFNDARSNCLQVCQKDLRITISLTPFLKYSKTRTEQFKEHCNGGVNAASQCIIFGMATTHSISLSIHQVHQGRKIEMMFLLWVNDCFITGPEKNVNKEAKAFGRLFTITNETPDNALHEYAGCKIDDRTKEYIKLTQPVKIGRF